eukprot:TRINITY_DN88_c0_g1_i1.p1 TRINITY_DN88_c0_g1~~TRINITY_DN88_c0_g1_i1.p1  ORF type:complete len:295 (-),score=106.59 TRINITY_DN88_c0_g1_i1:56-940(-)
MSDSDATALTFTEGVVLLKEMFDQVDESVVKAYLEACGGDVEAAAETILSMMEESMGIKHEEPSTTSTHVAEGRRRERMMPPGMVGTTLPVDFLSLDTTSSSHHKHASESVSPQVRKDEELARKLQMQEIKRARAEAGHPLTAAPSEAAAGGGQINEKTGPTLKERWDGFSEGIKRRLRVVKNRLSCHKSKKTDDHPEVEYSRMGTDEGEVADLDGEENVFELEPMDDASEVRRRPATMRSEDEDPFSQSPSSASRVPRRHPMRDDESLLLEDDEEEEEDPLDRLEGRRDKKTL